MPKIPFNIEKDFHKFDPTSIDAPQIGMTVRDDHVRAFRIVGLALLVVFCSALGVLMTSAIGPLG
ncbi:MAG TPA: hypothetical protein PKA55_19130 [Rhodoblastus sp.]|nr:hypothetical protein [Rhodoblastus sp.]